MPLPGTLPLLGATEADPAPFVVRIDLVGGRVQVSGRLDRRTVHLVHDAVSALLQTDCDTWVLDVAGLTGCDPAGLRTIGAVYRRALRGTRRLTVVGARPWLQGALSRVRLDSHVFAPDGIPVPRSPVIDEATA